MEGVPFVGCTGVAGAAALVVADGTLLVPPTGVAVVVAGVATVGTVLLFPLEVVVDALVVAAVVPAVAVVVPLGDCIPNSALPTTLVTA